MNKLLLNNNPKARNHIKFLPLCIDDLPVDEREQIEWCESRFNALLNADNIKRLFMYKNVKKGYLVSVWEYNELYYIIQSIRDVSYQSYINTIYINNEREDSINIAKFLQANVQEIKRDFVGIYNDILNTPVADTEPVDTVLENTDVDTVS